MTHIFKYFAIIFLLLPFRIFTYEIKQDHVLQTAKMIKLIALDVDGVLTHGEIVYTSNGDEIKMFNVKDGLGLVLASNNGFITAIITGRASPIVEKRGQELKICHVYQNIKDKGKVIEELAKMYGIGCEQICYMGDDLPDLPALQLVGLSCCPSDAVSEVRDACNWISDYEGGRGAVRELIDCLIKAKKS